MMVILSSNPYVSALSKSRDLGAPRAPAQQYSHSIRSQLDVNHDHYYEDFRV
jgi:hypothetical protein